MVAIRKVEKTGMFKRLYVPALEICGVSLNVGAFWGVRAD